MIVALATLVGICLVAAHLLPGSRLAPSSGIALWLTALALRAVVALAAAAALIHFLPRTEPFRLVTGWCLHAVLPYVSAHLGLSGHRLGETAAVLPGALLAISLLAAVFGAWRAARALSSWLGESAIGTGPRKCLIVGGPEIVVAAAGLRHPRVIVSAGALAALDEEELQAGLAHERAHIGRRHSYLSLIGGLLFAIGRVVPGNARSLAELSFHLERDADESAVRRDGNPLALAAAICKAGRGPQLTATPLIAGLAGCAVSARLRLLLDRRAAQPSRALTMFALGLAASMAVSVIALLGAGAALGAGNLGFLTGHVPLPLCQG